MSLDGRIDGDDLSVNIYQRSARVAGVDRGVGLDKMLESGHYTRTADETDDAGGIRSRQAERISNGDHQIAHHQGSGCGHVATRLVRRVRHGHFPHRAAGEAIEADQVSVVGGEEDPVAHERHAAIRLRAPATRAGVAHGNTTAARPCVAPDLASRARVQRAHLAGSGDIHHAIADQRGHLQIEIV